MVMMVEGTDWLQSVLGVEEEVVFGTLNASIIKSGGWIR